MRNRRINALVRIARALLADPHGQHFGYDTQKAARVRSYVLYSLLDRMLENGWLTDGWEDPAETGARHTRRYYELTDDGRKQLTILVTAASVLDTADETLRKKRTLHLPMHAVTRPA